MIQGLDDPGHDFKKMDELRIRINFNLYRILKSGATLNIRNSDDVHGQKLE
jgi:hypothetical protein